jgi:hypothetical protein
MLTLALAAAFTVAVDPADARVAVSSREITSLPKR